MTTTPPRQGIRRLAYVYGWRLRYWYHDTEAGHGARRAAAWLQFLGAIAWVVMDAIAGEQQRQQQAWIWYVVVLVASLLISYAMAPKPPGVKAQRADIPVVEDGAGIVRPYGPVWITDPVVIGAKLLGTDAIRKKAGKSLAMKTKWQTIGHHYKWLFHFGLCRGPIDFLMAIRAGDKPVWSGRLSQSGIIQINKPDVWGGEEAEGGLVGPLEIMMGDQDQMPNSYLAANLGPMQSAYRGRVTAAWRGGRWGNSPRPQGMSFMLSRILRGWDGDSPWYPEKAQVPLATSSTALNSRLYIALDRSGSMSGTKLSNMKAAMLLVLDALEDKTGDVGAQYQIMLNAFSDGPSIIQRSSTPEGYNDLRAWVSALTAGGGTSAAAAYTSALSFFPAGTPAHNVLVCMSDGSMSNAESVAAGPVGNMIDQENPPYSFANGDAVYMRGIGIGAVFSLELFDNSAKAIPVITGSNPQEAADTIMQLIMETTELFGINPAHVLYDSLTAQEMDGEPVETVSDASFRAAADRLHAEGFGIGNCIYDSTQESTDQFQQRIQNLIAGRMSRDPVTGLWHLDLLRDDYDLDSLPILTDDDILDYQVQPSLLDEAVNQVVWLWHDVMKREDRSTRPLQALGAIRSFGTVNSQSVEGREIITEPLALRCADRELNARATPVVRHTLRTTRHPYAWRSGQYFRLQSVRHGIADMVCILGDISRGTLKSGAISITSAQHVAAMAETVYAGSEPGVDTGTSGQALASPGVRAMELPYRELAEILSDADLAVMSASAGYAALFARTAPGGLDYVLFSRPGLSDFTEAADGEWCASALVIEASTHSDPAGGVLRASFSLDEMDRVDSVVAGTAALWGDEIVRVDAIDPIGGTIVLGRGTVDTIPQEHAAGTRIWFYDDAAATDPEERAAGQTIELRALTRTPSDQTPVDQAPGDTVLIAGRAALPYPMGLLRFNGEPRPTAAAGDIAVTWASRDRVAQGVELVDHTAASTATATDTRWCMRVVDSLGAVLVQRLDIAGEAATIRLVASGDVTIEAWALNNAGASMQRYSLTLAYTSGGATENQIEAPTWTPLTLVTDGGEVKP